MGEEESAEEHPDVFLLRCADRNTMAGGCLRELAEGVEALFDV
jgi:hypothetical protein